MTKNLPDMHLGPELTMAVDVTHLAAVMLLGLTALMARLLGRGRYMREGE